MEIIPCPDSQISIEKLLIGKPHWEKGGRRIIIWRYMPVSY